MPINGKQNGARKFSGGGPRPDLRALRQKEAQERQSERDKLSPKEQLKKLDQMLGAGQGAKKERARLDWMVKTGKKAKGKDPATPSLDVLVKGEA